MFTWLKNRPSRIHKAQTRHITLPLTLLFLEWLEKRELLAASIDAFVVPSVGLQGDAIAMSAQASSDISGASLTYTWNFGDGSNQSGVDLTDVSHAYTAPSPSGSPYVVTLTVTDGDAPASATSSITIDDVPPTINAGPSQTVRAGDTVTFNGSASDAGGPGQIASIQWDFNYNGSTFNPDPSADGNLTPSHLYATPGTYVVAMQATDQSGAVSQDFTTVTVKPADALIVNAGPDVTATAGQSVTLSGSYSDPGGSVSSSGIAWDTNYNGDTFNPVVTGTLTPNVTFTTPGDYQVALQITDSTGSSDISVLNVTVQPVSHIGPTAAAGTDQTLNEGDTAAFNGSYTDPDGTVSSQNIAWDFNYDGVSFNPMTTGSLTPTHQFTTPGDYTVALQITDSNGLTSLSTLDVTVNAVPPTATVSNSGPANVGSAVTFTVSNLQDHTPGDTPTYLVDWTGSGQFEELTSDEITTNPDGSISFTHTYDTPSGVSGYNAVVQIVDGSGGSSNYTTNVVVNDLLPSVILAPQGVGGGSSFSVDATVPFQFQFMGPQLTGPQTTYTYYVSLDGGAYTSSSSSLYLLPGGISMGRHTLTGYVQDNYGGSSQPFTVTAFVGPPQVEVEQTGSGQVNVNGTILDPSNPWYFSSSTAPLNVTLLTSNASYTLLSNVAIASLSVASGVTNVSVTVSTSGPSGSTLVGDGHIGTITLPGGGSTLNVSARGDLGSISGPTSDGTRTGLSATDLAFANLTGSITGLDSIQQLTAKGWLGTSASQQVEVSGGISVLSAYGVGATVQADLRQDTGDAAMSVGIGAGGVPGLIDGGNVAGVQITGDVNVFESKTQESTFDPPNVQLQVVGRTKNSPTFNYGNVQTLLFLGTAKVNNIRALSIGTLGATNSLTVTNQIVAGSIGAIQVTGTPTSDLSADDIIATGEIGPINVGRYLFLRGTATIGDQTHYNGTITASNITSITVGTTLIGNIVERNGAATPITVRTGNFYGSVDAGAGSTRPITVGRDFRRTDSAAGRLVQAKGAIGDITVGGNLGGSGEEGTKAGIIEGETIGTIQLVGEGLSKDHSNLLSRIEATNGNIKAVKAPNGSLLAAVTAKNGDVISVVAREVDGNIRATGIFDGSIHYVESTRAVPETVSIRADWYVGKIVVINPGPAAEKFQVYAQSGATWDAAGDFSDFGPVIIEVGASIPPNKKLGGFLGRVRLSIPEDVKRENLGLKYLDGEKLLTVVTNTANTTWSIQGPADESTTVDALFAELRGGTFGLVTNGSLPVLSNKNFSIQGPSGKR